jgi:hypothetical protein
MHFVMPITVEGHAQHVACPGARPHPQEAAVQTASAGTAMSNAPDLYGASAKSARIVWTTDPGDCRRSHRQSGAGRPNSLATSNRMDVDAFVVLR